MNKKIVNEFNPDWRSPPSDTLKELLGYYGVTIDIMNVALNNVPITDGIAEQLEELTNIPKLFWVNRESQFQEPLV